MTTHEYALEVAVYTVHDNTPLEIQRNTHSILATFDGFCRGVKLKGLEKANLRADVILWTSAPSAIVASQSMQSDERFAAFMASIDTLIDFHHYQGVHHDSLLDMLKPTRPVVEIASYDTQSIAQMRPLQARVHETVESLLDARSFVRGYDDKQRLLDILGWPSVDSHHQAPPMIESQHPELLPFFAGVGQLHVFELFEVI